MDRAAVHAAAQRGSRFVGSDPAVREGASLACLRDPMDARYILVTARLPFPPEDKLPSPTAGAEILSAMLAFCEAVVAGYRAIARSDGKEVDRSVP